MKANDDILLLKPIVLHDVAINKRRLLLEVGARWRISTLGSTLDIRCANVPEETFGGRRKDNTSSDKQDNLAESA